MGTAPNGEPLTNYQKIGFRGGITGKREKVRRKKVKRKGWDGGLISRTQIDGAKYDAQADF